MKEVMSSRIEQALTLQGIRLRRGVLELSVGHNQEVRDNKNKRCVSFPLSRTCWCPT